MQQPIFLPRQRSFTGRMAGGRPGGVRMQDLDKAALGARIRMIRTQAELRQWELARLLGTTQSAVHKYEHGVVPEPRRLVELARIGNTSIEWILTGHHWESGSEDQARLTPELLEMAAALRGLADGEKRAVDDALRIVSEAVHALESIPDDATANPAGVPAGLRPHAVETQRVLESAWRIQKAVLRWIADTTNRRLGASSFLTGLGEPGADSAPRRTTHDSPDEPA